MSPSIASMFFLIPSILLLFSTPIAAISSSTLIKRACSTTRKEFGLKLCTQVLQSQPMVVSATNLFDLSVGIIKSGISRSTNTRTHVESSLKKRSTDPHLKGALQECKSAYDAVIASLNSALSEVNIKEYQTATYDLLLAGTDNIQACQNAVTSKGMKDEIILSGNKVVPIFGLSAYEAVEGLLRDSKTN